VSPLLVSPLLVKRPSEITPGAVFMDDGHVIGHIRLAKHLLAWAGDAMLAKRDEACSAGRRSLFGSASRSGCELPQLPVPPLPVHAPFVLDLALAVVIDSSALIGRNAVVGMRVGCPEAERHAAECDVHFNPWLAG
jgi:hypothetical protein